MANRRTSDLSPFEEDRRVPLQTRADFPISSQILANRILATRAGLLPLRESSPVISSESSHSDSSPSNNSEILTISQQVALKKPDKQRQREEFHKNIDEVTRGLMKSINPAKDAEIPVVVKGKLCSSRRRACVGRETQRRSGVGAERC